MFCSCVLSLGHDEGRSVGQGAAHDELGWGKKRKGQGVLGDMQGILCKPQNFVVSKAKHLCLPLSCKQNTCDCFFFIPDLVPKWQLWFCEKPGAALLLLVCEDELLVVKDQAKECVSSAKPCSGLAASDTQHGSKHPCGSKPLTIMHSPRASGSKESGKREGTTCPCQFGKC